MAMSPAPVFGWLRHGCFGITRSTSTLSLRPLHCQESGPFLNIDEVPATRLTRMQLAWRIEDVLARCGDDGTKMYRAASVSLRAN